MDSSRSPAWLLLAACALTYPAYMTACAAQLMLPTLTASLFGHVLIEEVRVTPQWLLAWGYSADPVAQSIIRNGPLLFGCLVAFAAIIASRRTRPGLALFLHQLAIWSIALLAGRAMPVMLAIPLLLGCLLSLVRCTRDHASPKESVTLGFTVPSLIMLVILWRIGGRLPGPGPRSGLLVAWITLSIVGLALAAVLVGRRLLVQAPQTLWPRQSAIRSAIALASLLILLLAYRPLSLAINDWHRARYSTEHYDILYSSGDYTSEFVRVVAEEREQRLQSMIEHLGNLAPAPHFRLHLFPTQEDMYERARSTEPYTVAGADIFALAIDPGTKPDSRADAEVLLDAALPSGRSQLPFLRQAMIEYVAGMHGDAGAITWQEGPYSLTLLSNTDYFISPIVRRTLAGEFAHWITQDGPDALVQLLEAEPGGADWRLPLENRWRAHLQRLAAHWQPGIAREHPHEAHHYGVAFSNDGGAHTGYISTHAAVELRKLASRGANSVALTAPLPVPDANTGSFYMLAGDSAIDHATEEAHRAGLNVMLKPGGTRATTNWNAYRQWMLHYARLAEHNGTDLLCIGGQTIAFAPGPGEWRRLIANIRRVYRGPLTYAATPEQLLETSIEFWDALDYIGVDDYLPLTDRDSNTAQTTLAQHAQILASKLEQLSVRTGKPVILTEVGYPSTPWGATNPLRLASAAPQSTVDLDLQRRCYEATVEAFQGRSWLAGAYWSRWPSSGFGGGPDDGGFTPMGKPAETVMAKLWQR